MYKVINAITNDLRMYMWGSSIRRGGIHSLPAETDARRNPISAPPEDQTWLYEGGTVETVERRSRMRVQGGKARQFKNGREAIDCGKFKRDLKDVGAIRSRKQ